MRPKTPPNKPPALADILKRKRELDAKIKQASKLAALVDPAAEAADAAARAKAHSELVTRKQRADSAARAEIGVLPEVVHQKRRKRCRRDLFDFLQTYFPHSTGKRAFSDDHRVVVADIQECILCGGRRVNAVYREFGKTTLAENSILWATLYGHRTFALLTGINLAASAANIDSIKTELMENDLLAEDFPEVCHPIRCLEGRPQRCASQTCGGVRTSMVWRAESIVLPTVKGSKASNAIIMAKPYAKARGVKFKRDDGQNARPDFILADDIQDDETGISPVQVRKNINILKKNLLHTAGHERQLAIVVNGTVIGKNDLLETLLIDPAWSGERIKFVRHWADLHKTFWLGEYAETRQRFNRMVAGDKDRAHREATALYAARRSEADAGCVVSWLERYNRPRELSAIQHAYNVLIDDGPEVFASEYQNEPLDERAARQKLTVSQVASKTNGLARGVMPNWAEHLTAYIDVHLRVLYYVVAAWKNPLQGAVLDYGTYPKQPVVYFAQASAPAGMDDIARKQGGMSEDAWILAGLTRLADMILGATFLTESDAPMHVGKVLVDARWGQTNALVKQFCRRHPQAGTRLMPAQGYGSGTRKPPLRTLPLKPGAQEGIVWRILPPTDGDRWVTIDTNACKTITASRLALPLGTPGGIELFGVDPREHALFADHCVAEAPMEITAGGLTYDAWEWLLPHSDNHWWDCLVGAMVAGMTLGCRLAEWGERRAKKRITLAELAARTRHG